MKPEPAATIYAARIVGPMLLAGAGILVFDQSRMLAMAAAFVGDDLVSLLAGFLSLTFGLVILAFHWKWGSPTQAAVSLLGVFGLIRGALLLFLPALARGLAQHLVERASVLPLVGAVLAFVGLWLAYAGWLGKASA